MLSALLILMSLLHDNPVIHLSLHRRGGRFVRHEPANLTTLQHLLEATETKYKRTYRSINSNRLVRKWIPHQDDQAMLDEAGLNGIWYITLNISNPPQLLDLDVNLLNPDFYTIMTTSPGGSKFNTFISQSHVSGDTFVHPICRLASDIFHLPQLPDSINLDWPICQPSKSSRHTLSNSSTMLGLAPNPPSQPNSLSRLTAPSLTHQLYQKSIIPLPIWSMTILDSTTGILSLGGALAAEFEEVKTRTEIELKYLGQENALAQIDEEVKNKMAFAIPAGSSFEDHFKWIDVSGVNGWWTGLIGGIWIDGVKILKSQPFLLDLSSPFIIAPPTAFNHLYNSISGSRPLSQNNKFHHSVEQRQQFHLFPCLNPPKISIELAGWPFPLSSPSRTTNFDALHGPAGGFFSLGKIEEYLDRSENVSSNSRGSGEGVVNSGFCVGIIVGSDMGEREEWSDSGMRDTWVLGEPFFRGLGLVFDDGEKRGGKARVGFRIY